MKGRYIECKAVQAPAPQQVRAHLARRHDASSRADKDGVAKAILLQVCCSYVPAPNVSCVSVRRNSRCASQRQLDCYRKQARCGLYSELALVYEVRPGSESSLWVRTGEEQRVRALQECTPQLLIGNWLARQALLSIRLAIVHLTAGHWIIQRSASCIHFSPPLNFHTIRTAGGAPLPVGAAHGQQHLLRFQRWPQRPHAP